MSKKIKNAIGNLIETVSKKPQLAISVFRASSFSDQNTFAIRSISAVFRPLWTNLWNSAAPIPARPVEC